MGQSSNRYEAEKRRDFRVWDPRPISMHPILSPVHARGQVAKLAAEMSAPLRCRLLPLLYSAMDLVESRLHGASQRSYRSYYPIRLMRHLSFRGLGRRFGFNS